MLKRKWKTVVAIVLVISAVLSLTGCKGFGGISGSETKSKVPYKTAEEERSAFNPTENPFKEYTYKTFDNGRGFIRMQYPDTWKMSKTSDYRIVFQAPEDDPHFPGMTLIYRSRLGSYEVIDTDTYKDEVNGYLREETYSWNGDSFKIANTNSVTKRTTNSDIQNTKANAFSVFQYEDIEVDKGIEDLYMENLIFFWDFIPISLSAITENEKSEDLKALLQYMMSNSKAVENSIAVTEQKKACSVEIPICPLYESVGAQTGASFSDAAVFACPSDTGTGFSQSSIAVYEMPKDEWIDEFCDDQTFELFYYPTLLANAFGSDAKDKLTTSGYFVSTGGNLTISGKKAKEYIYEFAISETKETSDILYQGQDWVLAMYKVDNGDKVDLFVLTTTKDAISATTDVMMKIAEKTKWE